MITYMEVTPKATHAENDTGPHIEILSKSLMPIELYFLSHTIANTAEWA